MCLTPPPRRPSADATAPSPAPARAAAPVAAAPAPAAAPAVVEWVEGKVEESAPDADGVITVTEYTTDKDSGKRQKVRGAAQ